MDRPTHRGWRRPRTLVIGGLVVVIATAGIALWATGSAAASGYRTAVATTADVRQTLGMSGSVSPVHQATTDFQVAGTVSAVNVTVGQQVTAGEILATLDPTALAQDVSSAQSNLTAAQAKLSEDESSQSSSSTSSTGSTPSTGSTGSTPSTGTAQTTALITTTAASSSSAALQQAQQAVVTAQQTADSDSVKAATAFAAAQTACSSSGGTTSTTTTTSPTSTTTTTSPTDSAACTTAIGQALAAQQQVSTDQNAVASAESALAQLLSTSASSSGTPGGTANGSGSSGNASGGGSGTTGGSPTAGGSGSAGSGSTASNSAQQLASDQASIDSANASLINAQQSLADAQLASPLAGTVASVGLAVGQTVTSGSTTDVITIINSGSYQATTSLTSAQAPEVKVGDTALVTVNGTKSTLTGTVARVGPVDTSSSTYTYPLIVALPAGSHNLAAGSTAQVQVVLHEVDNTLAVPTSAVHTTGTSNSYVFVLESGQEVQKRISVGVVGGAYTQIKSGVTKDQTVVLADLSEAVPTSSSSTSTRTFGGGGFGGAGFGGAGIGGGGVGAAGLGGGASAGG